jgi:hypothetical protein
MPSYRIHETINLETKKAAKEKTKKYIPSLAAITAIAAKIKKAFVEWWQGVDQ